MSEPTIYFDDYTLQGQPLALSRDGLPVPLSSQPLRLLRLLASHAGEVVSHRQIREHLWGEQVVDFAGSVHVCISQIRAALGDNGKSPQFIETIPRRGYRFLRALRSAPSTGKTTRSIASPGDSSRWHQSLWWRRTMPVAVAAAGMVTLAALLGVFSRPSATQSPAADAYKRGLYVLASDAPDRLVRSRLFFQEAIQADPDYAPAYASLANTYQQETDLSSARGYAERALALDEDLAEAHLRMAAVLAMGDWNWTAAERHIHRALDLDPRLAEAHHALASVYSVTGRMGAAIRPMEAALTIDPASTLLRADLGSFLYYQGNLDDAQAQCVAALRLDTEHHPSRLCLLNVAVARGEFARAIALAEQIMRTWQANEQEIAQVTAQRNEKGIAAFQRWRLMRYREAGPNLVSPTAFAIVQAALGDHQGALTALEQAVAQRRAFTPFIVHDPVFYPLRNEARFQRLLSMMNVRLS